MIWAWLGAAAVGLSLGLLGSGGAILTVPILVYLVGHDEKTAIVESLAIVGVIAAVGAGRAAVGKRLDWPSVLLLAIPGIAGATLGAAAARQVPGAVLLAILAILMLVAAVFMFRDAPAAGPPRAAASGIGPHLLAGVQGLGLGFVTGFVGVGGGFLIVPVLVLIRRLPMSRAVGTSLGIIAINCASGLLSHLAEVLGRGAPGDATPDWSIVAMFAAVGVAGSVVGTHLGTKMNQRALRRWFAVFLVLMAGFILVRQAPRVAPGVFGATSTKPAPHLEP